MAPNPRTPPNRKESIPEALTEREARRNRSHGRDEHEQGDRAGLVGVGDESKTDESRYASDFAVLLPASVVPLRADEAFPASGAAVQVAIAETKDAASANT